MDKLQELIDNISEFTSEQFNQTKDSILLKLDEELSELKESKDKNDSYNEIMEFIDCFHLILDYASQLNISSDRLISLTHSKLLTNKSRDWNDPNKDGVIKHKEVSNAKAN